MRVCAPLGAARVIAVETGGRRRYTDFSYRAGDAFLFGPETRGLPEQVQERVGRENSLFIPMQPQSRSLNLSNAVAVLAYEAWRQLGFASGPVSLAAAAAALIPFPTAPLVPSAPAPRRGPSGPRA